MLILLNYSSISDRKPRHQVVSFSANVHIFISLVLVWEFIHIPDLLHSLYIEPTWLNTRLVAFTCVTLICLVHGTLSELGLRLQNTLGALKLLVLALIPVSGLLYLAGVKLGMSMTGPGLARPIWAQLGPAAGFFRPGRNTQVTG